MIRLSVPWQRNVIGAIGVGAALAVLIPVQLWPQWSGYRDSVVPQRTALPDAAITVDGHTWEVVSVRRGDGDGEASQAFGAPAGTSLVVVTVGRSGAAQGGGCTMLLTDGQRRWSPDLAGALPLATGATGVCSLPGPLQSTFVVPSGTALQAVDIMASDGRIAVRLLL